MDTLIIKIETASEGGYMYDIYESEQGFMDGISIDGGLCTTTMANALGMAKAQAIIIIDQRKPEEK